MNGWIKIHKKIMKSAIWQDPLRLKAWMHILLSANYEDKEWLCNKEVVTIKKGQFITSNRKLQEAWGCSANTVRRILSQLQQLDMIKVDISPYRYTLLTVINYRVYQDKGYTNGYTDGYTDEHTDEYTNGYTDGTQLRIYKNNKEDEEYKYMASPDEISEDDQLDAEYEEDEDEYAGYVIPQKDEDGNWIDPEW